jgi:Zn finger protein HypA/HybF involved in hydrogenase expression
MAEYIEREAFVAAKRKWYCADCERRKGVKNGKKRFLYEIGDAPCRACDIGDMIDAVDEFPAADVAPVVRGRWVKMPPYTHHQPDEFECTACKESQIRKTNYCPNCGAKMEVLNDD